MNAAAAIRGARRGERRVLRLQRRLWFAQMAVWPTAVLLATLVSVTAWVVWRRKSREQRSAAAAVDAAPVSPPQATDQDPVPGT
jgi:hypothetical protein